MNLSFFLDQAKYTAMDTTVQLKTNCTGINSSILCQETTNLEKGHLVGYYMTGYTADHTLAFQNGRRNDHEDFSCLVRRV